MLLVMRRSLYPRSRIFRSLLALALLAWTALLFNAFAQPLAMTDSGATTQMATAMGGATATRCDGVTVEHTSPNSHPAPSHPAGDGHGCCQNGHCDCASLCGGIANVPFVMMDWQTVQRPLSPVMPARLAPASSAPPLRPPIA